MIRSARLHCLKRFQVRLSVFRCHCPPVISQACIVLPVWFYLQKHWHRDCANAGDRFLVSATLQMVIAYVSCGNGNDGKGGEEGVPLS